MFFRETWRERSFQRGHLKYVILDLVKDKPRYGYEIIRALEELSYGFYTPSAGTVYPTLQMLEEMGYVCSDKRDGKKIYTVTEEGRNFLDEQRDHTRNIRDWMKTRWNPDDMKEIGQTMHELKKLWQLVSQQARHGGIEKMQSIREVLTRTYKEIEDIILPKSKNEV